MAQKKNILYVFGGEKASGGEIVIQRLFESLSNEVNTHLFIYPTDYAFKLQILPIQISFIKQFKKLNRSQNGLLKILLKVLVNYISITFKTLTYIRQHHIDVVHANTLGPSTYLLPSIIISKILRIKTKWIWSDHDLNYHTSHDAKIANLCNHLFNHTLAVSYAVKEKFHNKDKVITLYNGLDTNQFKSDLDLRRDFRIENKISNNAIVIGLAGFISERKGQVDLIATIKKLHPAYPNIILIFAGNPLDETSTYFKNFLIEIANYDYIHYLGKISDMIRFYNGCDIIINNSSGEGGEPLGTTIYEAMACERLVIASAVGGTPEIIDNYVDGLIFENNTDNNLFSLLEKVLSDFDTFKPIKNEARNKVLRKFNIVEMKKQYLYLLNTI